MKAPGILAYLRAHAAELRQALRTTCAAAIAFAAIAVFNLPQGYWAVITAVLVVQTSVGGSLKAAFDRLWGTLAGALWGALISIAMPQATGWALGLAVVVAIAPLALLAALYPAFRVAPVTALILMLPAFRTAQDPVMVAADRILEILLGNLIGLGASLFILPARAHVLLRDAAASVARQNAALMDLYIDGLLAGAGRQGIQPLQARIRAAIKQAETAGDEAARERRMRLSDDRDPEPLVRTLYRVRHDLVMIGRAVAKPLPEALILRLGPALDAVRKEAGSILRGIADAFVGGRVIPSLEGYQQAIKALGAAWNSTTQDGLPDANAETERLFALQFALEQLGDDLSDLAARALELTALPARQRQS